MKRAGATCGYGYEIKLYQFTGTRGCYELEVDVDIDSSCVPVFAPLDHCTARVYSNGYSKGDVVRFFDSAHLLHSDERTR